MLVEKIRNLPGKGMERGKANILHSRQRKNEETILEKALVFLL